MLSSVRAWTIRTVATFGAIAATSCGGSDGPRYASEFLAVDLPSSASGPTELAVQACAGLKNRRLGGSVYVRRDANDTEWLNDLGLVPSQSMTADEFLAACMTEIPKCVRYSYANQQTLLPNIITVGTALGAVPLDENMTVACPSVAFDARVEFATDNTPDLATQSVFERFIRQTTGLAMLNPGYDLSPVDLSNPPITRDMPDALVDFAFSERLFTVFLVNGCDPMSSEHAVLSNVVNNGRWTTPVGVYGYNNSWGYAGYLWEAQTKCLESRNMGAIASETGNLSFFSTRRPEVTSPNELAHVEPEVATFDPTKKYVAFVVGDGDNVQFMMTARKTWLAQRIADCANTVNSCAPLTWSVSPHLAHLAPDVLDWYYETSRATGHDYFTLPPSGHLYAYPGAMGDADAQRFVDATERDARLLSTRTVVHWEETGTWDEAVANFLPRYAHAGGVVQGIIAINAPYIYPPFPSWGANEHYRVITGSDGTPLVVFRQREWRGVDDRDTEFFVSPQNMANEIAGYPAGSVTVVYMTSDGGLSLQNSFMELVKILPANVELVSTDAAASLAIAASGN